MVNETCQKLGLPYIHKQLYRVVLSKIFPKITGKGLCRSLISIKVQTGSFTLNIQCIKKVSKYSTSTEMGTSYKKKCYYYRQWRNNYLGQSKRLKPNWRGPVFFDIYYCIVFEHYYQKFIFDRETGRCPCSQPT